MRLLGAAGIWAADVLHGMSVEGPAESSQRPTSDNDSCGVLESWLSAGSADVSGLLAALTTLAVIDAWSPLTLETTRLVSEAMSAGWADRRLAEAFTDVLAVDAHGELDEQPAVLASHGPNLLG